MKDVPMVSVGIPVYNGEKTIARAIESIIHQDHTNLEIIISDNCSTDSTGEICVGYAGTDSRIQYTRLEQNQGSVANFNKVFNLSTGKFFMWVSHDDFHESTFISTCLKRLELNPEAALCAPKMRGVPSPGATYSWHGDLSTFANKNTVVSRYVETLRNFPAVAIYGLYRSSKVRKTSLLPMVIGSDLIFIQNLSLYGSFIEVDETLFTYYGREEWNTVDQDYAVFYGKVKKPWYYSPFLIVFIQQIKVIYMSQHSIPTKICLIGALLRFQFGRLVIKVALKVIKFGLPKPLKMKLATIMYWKFIHSPNIKVEKNDEYQERIIRPIVGLRSK